MQKRDLIFMATFIVQFSIIMFLGICNLNTNMKLSILIEQNYKFKRLINSGVQDLFNKFDVDYDTEEVNKNIAQSRRGGKHYD